MLLSRFNSHRCVQLKIFISFCLLIVTWFKRKNLQLKVSDLVHSEGVKRKLASEQVNKGVDGTNTWCNETKEVVLRFRDEYFIALMSYSFKPQSQE